MAFGIDVVHDVVGCAYEQSPACHWYYRKGHMVVILPLQDNHAPEQDCEDRHHDDDWHRIQDRERQAQTSICVAYSGITWCSRLGKMASSWNRRRPSKKS